MLLYFSKKHADRQLLIADIIKCVLAVVLVVVYGLVMLLKLEVAPAMSVVRRNTHFRTGDLIFVSRRSRIKFVEYGHVAMVIKMREYGQTCIWELGSDKHLSMTIKPIDALFKRVRKKKRTALHLPLLVACDRTRLTQDIVRQLRRHSEHMHYNFNTLFTIIADVLRNQLKIWLPTIKAKNHTGVICTKSVLFVLARAGVIEHPGSRPLIPRGLFEDGVLNGMVKPGFWYAHRAARLEV